MSTTTATERSPGEQLAAQAKTLVQNSDFAGAECLLRESLGGETHDKTYIEALYTLAVAQRYQQRYDEALATLDGVLDLDPGYARAFQEQGHTYLAKNLPDDALVAYERAVRSNPGLLASWQALTRLCKLAGLRDGEKLATERGVFLSSLPKELLAATSMMHDGKLYKAEQLCRHFLQNNKHHIEGMRLLAAIGERSQVLSDARFLLESCVEFAPQHIGARYDYANLLLRMQRFEDAHEQTLILIGLEPDNFGHLSLHANAKAGIGQHREAIELFNEVLEKSPRQQTLYVMRGHAEKTIGKFDDAIESYRRAYELQPDYGDSFWSMANTKTYRFTDDEMTHMREAEATDSISTDDRIHMCFALGKAHEDRSEYETSFDYCSCGNALKLKSARYRPEFLKIRTSLQIEICDREFFEQKVDVGCPAPDPIFIVGMPRAGSTLLEQILASHSMVDGTHELPHIIGLMQRLRKVRKPEDADSEEPVFPKILAELDNDYFRRFGEQFIEDTRIFRKDAPYFIDKNPNNFFYVGLIKLILPNAKVIDARRHPMSCCFSGFKQLFGQGQGFSYGLTEIGNYYREYVELMDHWNRVLPGFVLLAQHEDVIDDLETQVRRLLDFCDLPFEESCLEFYKTERSVRTPSSEQVRQPIYRSGLGYWQNYEPWLGPLKEALGADVRQRFDVDQ